jgi:hypothetical protein
MSDTEPFETWLYYQSERMDIRVVYIGVYICEVLRFEPSDFVFFFVRCGGVNRSPPFLPPFRSRRSDARFSALLPLPSGTARLRALFSHPLQRLLARFVLAAVEHY